MPHNLPARNWTRRGALRLVAGGAVGGAVSALAGNLPSVETARQARTPLAFPKGAIVRTLLADLSPDAIADRIPLRPSTSIASVRESFIASCTSG